MKNYYIYLILISSLVLSCESIDHTQDDDKPMNFSLLTKSDYGDTYRMVLYNNTKDDNNYSFKTSGTYYYNDGTYLEPYTDTPGDGRREGAITGNQGLVWICCVTPADAFTDGSIRFDPGSESPEFLATQLESLDMKGWGVVTLPKLKDMRSQFIINFYKKASSQESDLDYMIKDGKVVVEGSGDSYVKFHPSVQQISFEPEITGRLCSPLSVDDPLYQTAIDNQAKYGIHKYSYEITVPAAFYAFKDDVIAELGPSKQILDGSLLYLHFIMTQKGIESDIQIPLTMSQKKLEPMHRYVFNVIVSSSFVEVNLSIQDYSEEDLDRWTEIEYSPVISVIDTPWKWIKDLSDYTDNDLGDQIIK